MEWKKHIGFGPPSQYSCKCGFIGIADQKCKKYGGDYYWEGGATQCMMDLLSIINLQRWWIKGQQQNIIIVFFYVTTWYTNSHSYRTMEMMIYVIVINMLYHIRNKRPLNDEG